MSDLIKDTNFSATTQRAVDAFAKALTKRWRERVATDILATEYDFPKAFKRLDDGHEKRAGNWDYTDPVNRLHLGAGQCAFIDWATGGQESDLSGVSCAGKTIRAIDPSYPSETTVGPGQTVAVPLQVPCGMGQVLQEVEGWAWQEGQELFTALPKFDAHDQVLLEQANRALLKIGHTLGLEPAPGSQTEYDFGAATNGDLPAKAEKLGGRREGGQDWWAGWTGLTADALKDGFFDSVTTTVSNQAAVAGVLANLYALRSSIIEKARSSELEMITGAAEALDAKTESTVGYATGWKIVKAVGDAFSVVGILNKAAAGAGSVIKLVGSLGDLLNPDGTRLEYGSTLEEVMEQLWNKVAELKLELGLRETEYEGFASALRGEVYGVHSFNLELYDLTENSPQGVGCDEGYTVDVSMVLEVADTCFECAEVYEDAIIPLLGEVESAEASVAGRDGDPTGADTDVVALVAELRGHLTTACGRLYVAGEGVKAAAEAYAATDEEARASFERTMASWDEEAAPGHAGEWARDTDRSGYDPGEDTPAQGALQPGHADPGAQDYATALSGG